ncbi:hypothetical protein [Streptomyces sp. NRRL F-2799]|uniref:hypothetical protein n=1 Tax=Streptomyces sp. NRRL F-2799 TaxID=1463844 RepID=UPI00099D4353|nr:hypothetical protein [Streptomyces sp. NRRL F-2799]
MFAIIGGRRFTRDQVLAWEAERLPAAASKIGLPVPSGDLARQRTVFAESKLALGADEIKRRLARDLRIGDAVANATTRLSRGRRATSVCELQVIGGSASAFVRWFDDSSRDDYAHSMTAAHPDHFLIQALPDGRQEVVETTGGSPLSTRFLVDYSDLSTLSTPRSPDTDAEAAGVAISGKGIRIGGVRHEFRDVPGGFHARLCVEFPRATFPRMLSEHRQHLAIEFSNWVESAFSAKS